MRTYDPADRITYVHLAQNPAAPAEARPAHDECHRLPAGYPNDSLRPAPVETRARDARPVLVVLPGGAAAADGPSAAPPALRLAQ